MIFALQFYTHTHTPPPTPASGNMDEKFLKSIIMMTIFRQL